MVGNSINTSISKQGTTSVQLPLNFPTMEFNVVSVFLLLALSCEDVLSGPVSVTNSLVISTTESGKESTDPKQENNSYVNPQIYSMDIQTNVSNRFATTVITSKVRNLETKAAETTFSVILPENAFISQFVMEIGGKEYKAYVKEKEEAKQIYQQAVASGQSAGHVELNARDSKTFTVSVNIEPESKTIFRLTYEELLQRQLGQYELILNIHPGQIVDDLNVQVKIQESRPLVFVNTPALRSGNEISKNDDDKLKPSADVEIINGTSAIVKFKPDKLQQKNFAKLLGSEKETNGLAGQFIVQYDVERDPQGGEVLVRDGYFVHFFSPSELEPLSKHVVFVLDHSGSMMGRKIEQLTEAMQKILPQLHQNDLFSIVRFTEKASIWNVTENTFKEVNFNTKQYEQLESQLSELGLPGGVEATKENIEKAKNAVKDQGNLGLTNIIAGLEVGLFLLKRTEKQFPNKYQPMIVFLTDGFPNVDLSSGDEITETVTKINSGEQRTSIFSLSFGTGADKNFLRKLSSKNLGFSRHIFEAADASLQLQDFYNKISSPLLSNVTFKYVDTVTDTTTTHYPILFNGSELVVTGRTSGDDSNIFLRVDGICRTGPIHFKPIRAAPVTSLERLWAYLTVKQILKESETADNKTELNKKALGLALKYSFVTSVSSLVVVKPNQTDSVDSKPTNPEENIRFQDAYQGGQLSSHFISVKHSVHRIQPLSISSANGGGIQKYSHSYSGIAHPGIPYPLTTSVPPPTPSTTVASVLKQQNVTIPQWLDDLKNHNQSITTAQGIFKLGKSGDVTHNPDCPKTPLNGTGICTILFDCPQVFPVLSDISKYLPYFCPLNEYAGICCPKPQSITQ